MIYYMLSDHNGIKVKSTAKDTTENIQTYED
jgi:hypothetical protein